VKSGRSRLAGNLALFHSPWLHFARPFPKVPRRGGLGFNAVLPVLIEVSAWPQRRHSNVLDSTSSPKPQTVIIAILHSGQGALIEKFVMACLRHEYLHSPNDDSHHQQHTHST
jgi:hypothetical protein